MNHKDARIFNCLKRKSKIENLKSKLIFFIFIPFGPGLYITGLVYLSAHKFQLFSAAPPTGPFGRPAFRRESRARRFSSCLIRRGSGAKGHCLGQFLLCLFRLDVAALQVVFQLLVFGVERLFLLPEIRGFSESFAYLSDNAKADSTAVDPCGTVDVGF